MLYFKVLPEIRRIAQKAVEACFPETATGYNRAVAWTKDFQEEKGSLIFAYTSSIEGRAAQPLGAKPEFNLFRGKTHVYQADESGKIVKTTWPGMWRRQEPPRG